MYARYVPPAKGAPSPKSENKPANEPFSYARYVPQPKATLVSSSVVAASPTPQNKRKRDLEHEESGVKKKKAKKDGKSTNDAIMKLAQGQYPEQGQEQQASTEPVETAEKPRKKKERHRKTKKTLDTEAETRQEEAVQTKLLPKVADEAPEIVENKTQMRSDDVIQDEHDVPDISEGGDEDDGIVCIPSSDFYPAEPTPLTKKIDEKKRKKKEKKKEKNKEKKKEKNKEKRKEKENRKEKKNKKENEKDEDEDDGQAKRQDISKEYNTVDMNPAIELERPTGETTLKGKKKRDSSKEGGRSVSMAESGLDVQSSIVSNEAPADSPGLNDRIGDNTKRKKKKKSRQQDSEEPQPHTEEDSRHKSVLAKKAKALDLSVKVAAPLEEKTRDTPTEKQASPPVVHDLGPLPQPEPVQADDSKPTYSTVPAWLANPKRIPVATRTSFAELDVPARVAVHLKSKGMPDAFAVQSAAMRHLKPTDGGDESGDLLITASTGSGKTLAYALPVLRDLSLEPAVKLRAVVVLPTRELVRQAREAFELCANAWAEEPGRRRIQVGIAVGNQSLTKEQEALIGREMIYNPSQRRAQRHALREAADESEKHKYDSDVSEAACKSGLQRGHVRVHHANIDVLICTPGRLVEHVEQTEGFSLDFVRWLVIDEADRLLAQSFQQWVKVVMPRLGDEAWHGPPEETILPFIYAVESRRHANSTFSGVRKILLSATLTRDLSLLAPLHLRQPTLMVLQDGDQAQGEGESAEHALPEGLREAVIRVRDVNLRPLYLLALLESEHMASPLVKNEDQMEQVETEVKTEPYEAESNLEADGSLDNAVATDGIKALGITSSGSDSESVSSDSSSDSSDSAETDSSQRSRHIDAQLAKRFPTTVLIFTKSNESALRLSRLLALLSPSLIAPIIGTITSTTPTASRWRTLRAFAARRLRVLVASDLAGRGIDLRGLEHVVNYDPPPSVAAYVHRVGRTARAGAPGMAWTLVGDDESGWFWGRIGRGKKAAAKEGRLGDHGDVVRRPKGARGVERITLGMEEGSGNKEMSEERIAQYEKALERLGEETIEEKRKGGRGKWVAKPGTERTK